MSTKFFVVAVLAATLPFLPDARADQLQSQTIKVSDDFAVDALDNLAKSPKGVFQKYRPSVPSNMQLTSGSYQVSGSSSNPTIQMELCQVIGLFCAPKLGMKGDISIREASGGKCDKQYLMSMDLRDSDSMISQTYTGLKVAICYKKGANGTGTVKFDTLAQNGPSTMLAGPIRNFLNLQMPEIIGAVQSSLQAYQKKASGKQKQAELHVLHPEDGVEPTIVGEGETPAA